MSLLVGSLSGSSVFDFLVFEILGWMWYILGYLALWYHGWMVAWLLPWMLPFLIFWMDFIPQSSRKTSRLARRLAHGDVLCAYDSRLIILSAYMCYPWWSSFLTSNSRWLLSLTSRADVFTETLYMPAAVMWFPPWPPDGVITHCVMFLLVVCCHLGVSL